MPYLCNAIYLFALFLLSPWLIFKALTTGKYRRGMLDKFLGRVPSRSDERPCAWFHGVSVGEVHLLRQVVAAFRRRHPHWLCVVSTTTDTGFEEARKHFADLPVFFWPLDFSWAVQRALQTVKPSLVLLAEGELWPNFLTATRKQGIPVAVVNGRLSPRSFRSYQRLGGVARRLFSSVDLIEAQTEEYAAHYRGLGVAAERVVVTGNVKYDGVNADPHNPKTLALADLFGIAADELVWVCGSTQPPEEAIALDIFRRLQSSFPRLRLFLVPRQRERFEEVANLLRRSGLPSVRRSALTQPARERAAVILVDTIGELGAVWGLADVAFVGGSLDGRRGGQNMIEPAACGAAVLFGPHVWNFADAARRLVEVGGALQVQDAAQLQDMVRSLLRDGLTRQRLGNAAKHFVQRQQGATERTLDCLDRLIADRVRQEQAA